MTVLLDPVAVLHARIERVDRFIADAGLLKYREASS